MWTVWVLIIMNIKDKSVRSADLSLVETKAVSEQKKR